MSELPIMAFGLQPGIGDIIVFNNAIVDLENCSLAGSDANIDKHICVIGSAVISRKIWCVYLGVSQSVHVLLLPDGAIAWRRTLPADLCHIGNGS